MRAPSSYQLVDSFDIDSGELAGLTPERAFCLGVEWSLFDGQVGYNSTVLIQGPGQQGLSQTVICKQAGASLIIVTGTAKDKARLDVAKKLGADYTKVMAGLQQIDPSSKEGQELSASLDPLDNACGGGDSGDKK